MKPILAFCILLAAAAAPAQVIDKNDNPGSLWSDLAPDPLVDRTARRVGDLVTILISETAAASFAANTNLSKADSNAISTLFNTVFLDRLIPEVNNSATSTVGGKGNTGQTGNVTARLTAVVREVRPGGILVVEATRSVMVNRDLQSLRLSGLIRQDNVRPDNTVLSETIADLDLRMEGKGAIHDRQRKGVLTRLLDWLF